MASELPKRAGPNGLFIGLLVVTAGALVAALAIPPERIDAALDSVLVYRVEVAAIVWAVGYFITAGIWLGWHRRLYKRFPLFGLGDAETPEGDAQEAVDEIEKQAADMAEFRSTTQESLSEVKERLARLEGRIGG